MNLGPLEILIVSFVIVLLLALSARSRPAASSDPRLRAIDRKLDLILANLGIENADPLRDDVKLLMRQGSKIEAIKLYRERTGVGLKEAKDAVEAIGLD